MEKEDFIQKNKLPDVNLIPKFDKQEDNLIEIDHITSTIPILKKNEFLKY